MRQIDLHKLADDARFNRFHGLVLLWCALIIVFDGYDLAVVGIALPSIMKKMGVAATNAGFMVSSALVGMMFGAIFMGTIADRIGRRWAIAICVGLFSIFTAAAGLAESPIAFSAMRFLAGLGIGGVMPTVVAAGLVDADGKPKYTGMHCLRHFYASWCIDRKLPPKVIQERMGHATISETFDTYGHLFPKAEDAAEIAEAELAIVRA